ncbi:hypothetical protein BBJ28_00021628, partial [Nothophytophthora sp. Chile5]
MAMEETTPLWRSPASSASSVAGSTVYGGVTENVRAPRRVRREGMFPLALTPQMLRGVTIVGLLVAMTIYISGAPLSSNVQDSTPIPAVHGEGNASPITQSEASAFRAADDAGLNANGAVPSAEDAVQFLPGFGAPLEKQVRRKDDEVAGSTAPSILPTFWPFALVFLVVFVVLRLIGGACLDYYVWYVDSTLA